MPLAIVTFGGYVQTISEGLRATHHRMVKHVTREGQLLGPLWAKLSDTLFTMFSRYDMVKAVTQAYCMYTR